VFVAGALLTRSLAVSIGLAAEAWPHAGIGWSDEVSRVEATLAPARAVLGGVRRIGYASPVPNRELLGVGAAEATWRWMLARYVLAPVVVSRDAGVTPVLADFPTPEALDAYARSRGHVVRWRSGGLGIVAPPG
jgi:hypothetical protein